MMDLHLDELKAIIARCKPLGLCGLKSEYESEGVRPDELIRICSIAGSQSLLSALKIGGAEAKTDMYTAFIFGLNYIIAPMIETPYAAHKCVEAYKFISGETRHPPKLLLNIETKEAVKNAEAICDRIDGVATGIVFGRVDYTLSCGLTRGDILSEHVCDAVKTVAEIAKDRQFEFVVGGGISIDSFAFLKEVMEIRLDRFETRKCIIESFALEGSSMDKLFQDCVLIELLWLKSKMHYYSSISIEDHERIAMLEQRHLYNLNMCSSYQNQ